MAAHETQMPFIRNLASSDRKLRTSALESLQTFLASRSSLSESDAQKLWKGLFYALWMTDRPIPQQRLATDLAGLVFQFKGPDCVVPWLRGFWAVVGAQWTDIDVLRLEKFLLLVRRVFAAHVRLAAQHNYEGDAVDAIVAVLADYPFEAEGDLRKVPVGVRLHALDLWVDELEREGALADPTAAPFVKSIGDLLLPLSRCPVKQVRERCGDSYDDERLPWGTKAASDQEGDNDDESGDEWGGIQD
ncbi:nucleolar protein,Nop52-domain-containing protein [Dactylonectria macrodidyma]|uniref:Nucleolar protein,Nop52-domain-containing protein n=1 Tax=Dactylonectria macrodidyma TaxID=307937 RepID=A0A9P9IQI7_9HYPO|nr:nucleolar protein,Nop52-domain-containing protein [Dactylonectria macrodidyma]